MDNFCEQLVTKKSDSSDIFKKLFFVFVLIAFCFLLFYILAQQSVVMALFLVGVSIYLGMKIFANLSYEYEYIITNGELDVDKIIGKKKRKRLVSVNSKNFTAFGKYEDLENKAGEFTTVMAHDGTIKNMHYADFKDSNFGLTRLLFSPDERILNNLKQYLPRILK